jgi:hypothetical protein
MNQITLLSLDTFVGKFIPTVGNPGMGKIMAKSHLKLVTPAGKNPTVQTPRRKRNAEYGTPSTWPRSSA